MTRYKALQSKKMLVIALMLMGFLAFLPFAFAETHITNCTDLQSMNDNLSESYVLDNNIDCSDTINWNGGAGFMPIGRNGDYQNSSDIFRGTFEGQNFNISNLYSSANSNAPYFFNFGLFGYTDGATISNVNLINVNIVGNDGTGAFAGALYNSQIENCSARGNITMGNGDGYDIGGLIGYAENSSIDNCYFIGDVFGGLGNTGGLVGNSVNVAPEFTLINNSYAIANVSNFAKNLIGGFIGFLDGGLSSEIQNSYAIINIQASQNTGGLVGSITGITAIDNFYANINMTIDELSNPVFAGGYAGQVDGTSTTDISNSLVEGFINYNCVLNQTNINQTIGTGTFSSETNVTSNVILNGNCPIIIPPVIPPVVSDVTQTPIYMTLNSAGAGLGIFMQYLGIALPILLIGLAMVGIIFAIAYVVVYVIKSATRR